MQDGHFAYYYPLYTDSQMHSQFQHERHGEIAIDLRLGDGFAGYYSFLNLYAAGG